MDEDSKREWLEHEHTALLRTRADGEQIARFMTLAAACNITTDPNVAAAYANYCAAMAVRRMLRDGEPLRLGYVGGDENG
jgi:hypothetical protein